MQLLLPGRPLGTDRLLRPKGGRWFWRGGTILKQASFWGVNFSLVRNMRGVKFYDTATAVWGKNLTQFQVPREGLFDMVAQEPGTWNPGV